MRATGQAAIALLLAAIGLAVWYAAQRSDTAEEPEDSGALDVVSVPEHPVFTKDVAPVVYENCVSCHRPGQVAPFPLIAFEDVRDHGRQIVEVIKSGYMPPFLPDARATHFRNARQLKGHEVTLLERWVEQGMPRGDAGDLAAPPEFPTDWQLGEPDLVVSMDREYTLPPEGENVFRHFVVEIPTQQLRFVKGFEFRTTNPRIVHHARFLFDRTQQSRTLDEVDPEPGYALGMGSGSGRDPDGHWLGWTPGKQPVFRDEKYSWPLRPGSDLIMELHMLPTGKPEPIRCEMAFYYSDSRPTNLPVVLRLGPSTIDIPPGEADYRHTEEFRIPIDVDLLNVYPHAHLLAQSMQAFAKFPDGKRTCLLKIDQWDFNWQDEYQYAEPIRLPRGTTLEMEFRYDNSASNIRNPASPPRRVTQGPETSDEMGDLWFQMVPVDPSNRRILADALARREAVWAFREAKFLSEARPDLLAPRSRYGVILAEAGRLPEARAQFEAALKVKPDCVPVLNNLAVVEMNDSKFNRAEELLTRALGLSPGFPDAINNFGKLRFRQEQYSDAIAWLRRYVEISPRDSHAWLMLATCYRETRQLKAARDCAEFSLKLDPNNRGAVEELATIRASEP